MQFISNPTLILAVLAYAQAGHVAPSAGGGPSAPAAGDANGVPQLKADNFDSFIQDSQLAMIKFFAPCTTWPVH